MHPSPAAVNPPSATRSLAALDRPPLLSRRCSPVGARPPLPGLRCPAAAFGRCHCLANPPSATRSLRSIGRRYSAASARPFVLARRCSPAAARPPLPGRRCPAAIVWPILHLLLARCARSAAATHPPVLARRCSPVGARPATARPPLPSRRFRPPLPDRHCLAVIVRPYIASCRRPLLDLKNSLSASIVCFK
ncbi:hypothetical protein AXF42_Ash021674 [Apostasia shenzhenica]|uniref:Uncharacterized protein n=1 Tax=Apostasia shenzhenica TaxID=1088818 RepID=A0A2H9ZVQ6_9ASPA|nr:hypothetical protein AXF42_Ash021674 [Apostasia shenzhenica]